MVAAREWYVISLRPRGQHGTVRRAAQRLGARMLALSTLQIQDRNDEITAAALHEALAADACIFTSPNAVGAAARLAPLVSRQVLAVGEGTAGALRREGVPAVIAPSRMDSGGLLDLAPLRDVAGQSIGLVTGAGGRDLIETTLQGRGADVLRADVYAREVVKVSPTALRRFDALQVPTALLASSGEALEALMQPLDEERRTRMRAIPVIVPGTRLAAQAKSAGFHHVVLASSPRPARMVAAAADALR